MPISYRFDTNWCSVRVHVIRTRPSSSHQCMPTHGPTILRGSATLPPGKKTLQKGEFKLLKLFMKCSIPQLMPPYPGQSYNVAHQLGLHHRQVILHLLTFIYSGEKRGYIASGSASSPTFIYIITYICPDLRTFCAHAYSCIYRPCVLTSPVRNTTILTRQLLHVGYASIFGWERILFLKR